MTRLKLFLLALSLPLLVAGGSQEIEREYAQATASPQPQASSSAPEKKPEKSPKDTAENYLALAAIVGIAGGYLIVLWRKPLYLLKLPSEFASPKIGPIPEFKLPIGIIQFLKYRPRVLDAWVAQRITRARQEFDRRKTVEEHQIHISLPVLLDRKSVNDLTAKDLRDASLPNSI